LVRIGIVKPVKQGGVKVILFKPEHVQPILEGRKTQTRRTGKKRWNVGSVHQAKLNFKKGSKPFAYLKITDVRQERLGNITEADAWAEGYGSIEEYKEVFKQIYGYWNPDINVWVVNFEVVKGGAINARAGMSEVRDGLV